MKNTAFKLSVIGLVSLFVLFFCVVVVPPLLQTPDVLGAFAAGFVNPYAAGYSFDVIVCYLLLVVWVLFERREHGIKGGWICLALGIVPGVAVGFGLYLLTLSLIHI